MIARAADGWSEWTKTMLNLNRGWKHTSYYMMIGACAWFCCVAKIARQIMIFDLDLETTSNLNQKICARMLGKNSEKSWRSRWDQAQKIPQLLRYLLSLVPVQLSTFFWVSSKLSCTNFLIQIWSCLLTRIISKQDQRSLFDVQF